MELFQLSNECLFKFMHFPLNYALLSYSGVREEMFFVCLGVVRHRMINVVSFLPECCSNKLHLWF